MHILKMESVYKAPFLSIGHALGFLNRANPARRKNINLLEPEGRSTAPGEYSSEDLWAAVLGALERVIKEQERYAQIAFRLRNIGDTEKHWSVQDIAHALHISPRRLYRALNKLYDELEQELVRRGLIDPPFSKKD